MADLVLLNVYEKLNLAGFERPEVLYLVPFAWVALLGLAWWSRAPLARGPRLATGALRAAVVSAILVTIAGPFTRVEFYDPVHWIVVRDASASRPPVAVEADRALIERVRRSDDHDPSLAEVVFAADVDADDGELDPYASAPQTAFGRARGLVRPDRRNRILVLTDGRFSRHLLKRDWPSLHGAPVTVYHTNPGRREGPDPRARSIRLPGRIDAGERFAAEVRYTSDRPAVGKLRVSGLGTEIPPTSIRFSGGRDSFATIDLGPLVAGDYTLRVELTSDGDRDPRNNALIARLTVGAAPRVLIIDDGLRDGGPIRAALEAQGILCTVTPELADGALDSVRAVVLRNRTQRLPVAALVAIRAFVDRGGGLLVLGGPAGGGLHGYVGTPLDAVLPVTPLPPPPPPTPDEPAPPDDPRAPEQPDRDPVVKRSEGPSSTIAMVLLIDGSNSMNRKAAGETLAPIAYAREAAIAAAEKLRAHDRLCVITFNRNIRECVAFGPVGERRSEIARRIASIRAVGGTAFLPPLRRALSELANERARVKHVILLTDGERMDDERSLEAKFEDLMGRMVDRKITVTAVALGADAETPFLAKLVRWNGRDRGLHAQVAPREIPEIFTLEVDNLLTRIGGDKKDGPDVDPKDLPDVDPPPTTDTSPAPDRPDRAPDDEGPTTRQTPTLEPIPVRRAQPHPLLAPEFETLPPVHGYDRAEARRLSWVAVETTDGEPVIATSRFGLGHVAVFGFDAGGVWSPDWVKWPAFSSILAETARFVGRPAPPPTRGERAGRAHPTELDLTGSDAFGLSRLERVLDAKPLPTLRPGPWPGEPKRSREEPMPPYLLLIAPLLFAIEIAIRRLAS